jgi:predicted DCC family thiol-disulfide oxidoreductase YuxK
VTFLFDRDKRHVLRFAPLQGETARRLLSHHYADLLDTMVLLENGETFERSDAALRALRALGGRWRLLAAILFLVPRPIRQLTYGMIARSRYKLFGRKDACRLPAPHERNFFLD